MKTVQQYLTNHLPAILGILIGLVFVLLAVDAALCGFSIGQ